MVAPPGDGLPVSPVRQPEWAQEPAVRAHEEAGRGMLVGKETGA